MVDFPRNKKVISRGSGPSIQYVQNHRKIQKKIREVASGKNIPLQLEMVVMVMIQWVSTWNTPTCIISTPLRHTHCTGYLLMMLKIKLFYETLIYGY
jgi:putative aminopeptidase FrvX